MVRQIECIYTDTHKEHPNVQRSWADIQKAYSAWPTAVLFSSYVCLLDTAACDQVSQAFPYTYIYITKKRNCHNNWQFVISDSDEWIQFTTMWRTTWQFFPHLSQLSSTSSYTIKCACPCIKLVHSSAMRKREKNKWRVVQVCGNLQVIASQRGILFSCFHHL